MKGAAGGRSRNRTAEPKQKGMTAEVATASPPLSSAGTLARVEAIPAWLVLTAMVGLSSAIRIATAFAHATPRLFPDEYIYSGLARSISHGRLGIRGTSAHFPALLEPLAAAPLWLFGNVDTAYRLTQGLHAVAMSLAAIPVYLLARRVGLTPWQRLGCAALTLALPALVFSSYITADAIGFSLALVAIHAGVVALEEATKRSQALFLLAAGSAVFTRVQYVVIPAAFAVAALILSRGRPHTASRRYPVVGGAFALGVAALLAAGPSRTLGYYHDVLGLHVSVGAVGRWIATDAMMIGYAAGVVIVPAALVGLWFTLSQPRSTGERAFGALSAAFIGLLLLEAGIYAASGTARFQERYLEAAMPLLPILFCLGMRQLETRAQRRIVAGLSLAFVLLSVLVPLSGYASGDGRQDSPFLQAVFQIEERVGVGDGSLLIAVVTAVLALVAIAAVVRPKHGILLGLTVATLGLAGTAAAAISFDVEHTRLTRDTFLPADARWVDRAGIGDVAALVTPDSLRAAVSEQLFWNQRITRLLQMKGAAQVDAFGAASTVVGKDGTLIADGHVVTGSLLVEEYADSVELTGATLVERTPNTSLWKSTGTPRLVSLTDGRYFDGWFGQTSTVTVWPRPDGPRIGTLCMLLSLPGTAAATVDLTAPGVRRSVRVSGSTPVAVAVPVVARERWMLTIKAEGALQTPDGRIVSTFGSIPRFIVGKASANSCR